MCSARPDEDLTARARIRDAAIRLFTDRGVGGTSIRDIAAEAGVSSGLIRHHFGSKEALRDACDSYASEEMNRIREAMFDQGGITDAAGMMALNPTTRTLQAYLIRSMVDGSEAATKLFDDAVRLSEEWLTRGEVRTTDLRAYAAVLVGMQMGVFLLRDQMSRALGVDVETPEGYLRMMRGFVDAFSQALLTPEQTSQIHQAMDRREDGGR
jgi:TetR/AcrR family transcriptional regulator, regulator of cefoperazone and chloramphenicol sensitivity